MKYRTMTVSYTHLDVYKRQTQQTDQWVYDYEKRYFRDFQSIFKSIDQRKLQYDKDLLTSKNNIVVMMSNYNNEFNIGFENSLNDIQTVSYTHLDVYKRQVVNIKKSIKH